MREGVTIALQRLGMLDMPRLTKEMDAWARSDSAYVQRAAAAGLCEPPLLKDEGHVRQVLQILDRITRSLAATKDRKSDQFKVLRQALGYCWSVAAAAAPEHGRPFILKWLESDDPDVQWIMRTNLAKARMARVGISASKPQGTAPRSRTR